MLPLKYNMMLVQDKNFKPLRALVGNLKMGKICYCFLSYSIISQPTVLELVLIIFGCFLRPYANIVIKRVRFNRYMETNTYYIQ